MKCILRASQLSTFDIENSYRWLDRAAPRQDIVEKLIMAAHILSTIKSPHDFKMPVVQSVDYRQVI